MVILNFSDHLSTMKASLRISEAAALIGVSTRTLPPALVHVVVKEDQK